MEEEDVEVVEEAEKGVKERNRENLRSSHNIHYPASSI